MKDHIETLYRIANWDEKFENHRSRPLKDTSWVPVPNNFDGDGYTKLLEVRNGCAHFGCWISLLQLASRSKPRGTLIRENGKPHTPETMSRVSGIPKSLYVIVLERLLDDEIGWIEVVPPEQMRLNLSDPAQDSAPVARDPAPVAQDSAPAARESAPSRARRTERNRTERSERRETPRQSWGSPPPADDPKQVQYLQIALSDVMGGALGMPDTDVVKNTLRKAGGATAEEVRQVFEDLRGKGKLTARSWGWFPATAAAIFENKNGTGPGAGS